MIDITGPKVLAPALLFAVLSPGLLLALPRGAGLLVQAVVHAVVLSIVYWALAKYVLKVALTTTDLIVPALLFVLLTPGVLLALPGGAGKGVQVGVHTLVFAIVFATLRSFFPQYY
jgi:uncharacterized membrane protein YwzB